MRIDRLTDNELLKIVGTPLGEVPGLSQEFQKVMMVMAMECLEYRMSYGEYLGSSEASTKRIGYPTR